MQIRELTKAEYDAALELSWRVFLDYEAPDYSQKGVDSFFTSIHDPEYIGRLRIYGAYAEETLIGVLATRSEGTHIALFFVDRRYHRQGVGKSLVSLACEHNTSDSMTVNSSPYSVEIYRHLGFRPTDTEQVKDGIRYTPMECILRESDCPCKRERCERRGNCVACREHHKTKRNPVACERLRSEKTKRCI